MLDKIDKKIIEELQKNSNRTIFKLSKVLNLPRTTLANRIKRLENKKIIKKYKAIIDPEKLGKKVVVFIQVVVSPDKNARELADKLKKRHFVIETFITAGSHDIMVKALLNNTKELGNILYGIKGLRSWPEIEKTHSTIVLETVKEHGKIMAE